MKAIWKKTAEPYREEVNHGLKDERGRAIGGRLTIQEGIHEPLPDGWQGGYWEVAECGPSFFWYVQATRNGKDYGASQPGKHAKTFPAAIQAGRAKLQEQRKRYAKTFAKFNVTAPSVAQEAAKAPALAEDKPKAPRGRGRPAAEDSRVCLPFRLRASVVERAKAMGRDALEYLLENAPLDIMLAAARQPETVIAPEDIKPVFDSEITCRDCGTKTMVLTSETMSGEHYKCHTCGRTTFLDYDEMR